MTHAHPADLLRNAFVASDYAALTFHSERFSDEIVYHKFRQPSITALFPTRSQRASDGGRLKIQRREVRARRVRSEIKAEWQVACGRCERGSEVALRSRWRVVPVVLDRQMSRGRVL